MSELRYALRTIARRPGFALLAGLSLSIGIGANAAIYSVIDAVILRPLPEIADVDRLVSIVSDSVSYPAYRDIRDSSRSFTGVAGFQHRGVSILSTEGARVGTAGMVTGNFFEVLGTRAIVGRTLQPSDDSPQGDAAVAVLSHGFWQQQFARRAGCRRSSRARERRPAPRRRDRACRDFAARRYATRPISGCRCTPGRRSRREVSAGSTWRTVTGDGS